MKTLANQFNVNDLTLGLHISGFVTLITTFSILKILQIFENVRFKHHSYFNIQPS